MQNLNRFGLTIILAALTLPTAANAESWVCEHGNLVREINVERETANPVPCSVKYDKEAEGLGSSVLWTAVADGAYCDAKANGLAEKLTSLGWSCTGF
ncbi:hypothetical protein N8198_06110 [Gammaproteobacteria bacterium]|nr:hypothetical protein [Gammaproteobacteria bacterium]